MNQFIGIHDVICEYHTINISSLLHLYFDLPYLCFSAVFAKTIQKISLLDEVGFIVCLPAGMHFSPHPLFVYLQIPMM